MNSPFNEAKYNALLNGLEISEVKLSEVLKGDASLRIDSEFFRKHLLLNQKLLENANASRLKTNLHSLRSFGAYSLCNKIKFIPEGIPFIRCMDMRDGTVDFSKAQQIDTRSNELLWKSEIKQGTVLLSMSGSIGNVALATNNWNYPVNSNQDIAKIWLTRDMSPAYLYAFFLSKHGKAQLERFKVGSVQQHVFMWQIENLLIPGFSNQFEKSLENIVKKAEKCKLHSTIIFSQAEQTLLNLIELNFLASENVSVKPFSSSFATSGRLDAEFYQPKYDELFARIYANSEYVKTIEEMETFNARGLQPIYAEEGTLDIINSRHILEDGLDYNNFEKAESSCWKKQKRARVQRNDILVYTTGANIGRSQPYLSDEPALASNHVNILRIKFEDPIYVAFVMNSLIGRMQTERLSAGTAQAELYPKDISQFIIPFVSKKMQNEIVCSILEARDKKAESRDLLEKARRAVEIAIEQGEEAAMAYLEGRKYVEQTISNDLAGKAPYFSVAAARKWLSEQKLSYKPETVNTYLSRQMRAGKIFDAGRGWYSSIEKSYQLDTAPVQKLVDTLTQEFPLLDFACWSTAQLNEMLRHQLARHVQLVYVERDAIQSVASWLRGYGYHTFANPGKQEIAKSFSVEDNTVIVLPLTTESPCKDGVATIEKIVVDVLADLSIFDITNIPELIKGAQNVIRSYRIDISILKRYATRRKTDVQSILKGVTIH